MVFVLSNMFFSQNYLDATANILYDLNFNYFIPRLVTERVTFFYYSQPHISGRTLMKLKYRLQALHYVNILSHLLLRAAGVTNSIKRPWFLLIDD